MEYSSTQNLNIICNANFCSLDNNRQYVRDMEYANLALHSYITHIIDKIRDAILNDIMNKAYFWNIL